ncbi:MAG: gliding motility lipoprotein GldB, partial [Algoriphagus sp.]
MYRLFLLLAIFFGLFSCQSSDSTCTLNEERLERRENLEIYRLEQEFFAAKSPEELRFLLEKYPEIAASLVQELLRANQDSAFQSLNAAVAKEFADISDIKVELEQAFAYLKSYYPDFKAPKVYTYVSGFGIDLLVEEDILV